MKASPGKSPSTRCRKGCLGPRSGIDLPEEQKIWNWKFYIFIIFLNVLPFWPSISCSGGFVYRGQGKVASSSTLLEYRESGSPKHQQVSILCLQPNVMNREWEKGVTNRVWYFEVRNSSSGMWNWVTGWVIPHDSSKCRKPFNQWHSVTPQKAWILNHSFLRTYDLESWSFLTTVIIHSYSTNLMAFC